MADTYSAAQTDVRKALATLKPITDALAAADKGLAEARRIDSDTTANRNETKALTAQIEKQRADIATLEQQKTGARAALDGIGVEATNKAATAESASQARISAAQGRASEAETAAAAAKSQLNTEIEAARQRHAAELKQMQEEIAAKKAAGDKAIASAEKRLADVTAAIDALKAKF